jgi:hypothetical protein
MKIIHLMTTVTTPVAVVSRMRAVEAFSPAGPHPRERLHSGAGKLFRRLRRLLNDLVADAIADREHRVAQFALRNPSDVELKDFGSYCGEAGNALHRYRELKFATRR